MEKCSGNNASFIYKTNLTMEKLLKEIIKHKKTCYFVSPHLDDAAFSAGGLISYLAPKTRVVVVTAFTRAGRDDHSLSALSYLKQCGYKANEIGEFFASRRKEDREAIENLNAMAIHLPFKDALWRKKRKLNIAERISTLLINELRYIYPTHKLHISKGIINKEDIKNLKRLEDKLKQTVDDKRDYVVFCPLALGNHVDHVMAREACTNSFPNVIFWEDSPYNLYCQLDKEFVKKRNLTKEVFSKNQTNRKNIYPVYKTQFGKLFGGKTDFSLPPEVYYLKY